MAPSAAAVLAAVARLAAEAESASTSSSLQWGHIAEAISRSSAVSCAQLGSGPGKLVPPFSSTLRKQPFALVQAGSPNLAR